MVTRTASVRRPAVLVPVLLALWMVGGAACGRGGGGDDGTAPTTGRLMSLTEARGCVSPDRGETSRCYGRESTGPTLEVGQCVTATPGPAGATFEVVDDAKCAAGDLGDG